MHTEERAERFREIFHSLTREIGKVIVGQKYLVERGFDPLAYRLFCLGAHYRAKLSFNWESLQGAARARPAPPRARPVSRRPAQGCPVGGIVKPV